MNKSSYEYEPTYRILSGYFLSVCRKSWPWRKTLGIIRIVEMVETV